jgi:bifunctional non-homologous end joining protein LigD
MPRGVLKKAAATPARRKAIVLPFPAGFVTPCDARIVGRPPEGPRWLHEIKYDGFRTQVHIRGGKVLLYSSGQHDWTELYRPVADEAAALVTTHAVLDGEMVVLRPDGTSDY